jgi:adenylate cyclase
MLSKLVQSPLVVGLVISMLVFLGLFGLRLAGSFETFELAVYDWYLRLRPDAPADARIVLITVTENDIRQQGTWPLPDATIAQALELLEASQPRAIGLDIYRDIPVPPGHDALETVLRSHPNIVAVTKVGLTAETSVPPPAVLRDTEQVGFLDVVVDPGGTVRRGLLFLDQEDSTFYSVAYRLALLYLQAEHIGPRPDAMHPQYLRLGRTTIRPFEANDGGYVRADARGYQFLLDFQGGHHAFPHFPLTSLLTGEVDPAAIHDKVVLVGITAISVKDVFYTPYSRGRQADQWIAGVAIQAHSVSQLLRAALEEHATITSPSDQQEALWLLLWSVLGTAAGLCIRSPWRLALLAGIGVLVLGLAGYGALLYGWWIPVVPPVLAWGLSGPCVLLYVSSQERTQRSVLMRLFAQSVSPEVAEMLWQQREQFMAGSRPHPQRLTATVLFTDLEGFTSVSECLGEQALVDWLETYLEIMSQQVMAHGGVINKYMGDAIMALFGVPIPRTSEAEISQDAVHAVQCALAMRRELIQLNRRWQDQQQPTIRMRVGIYTGPLVAGAVGSAERLEYTVYGDTVNTASRLESYEKETFAAEAIDSPCRILIGTTPLHYLGQQFQTQYVGEVHLKGKEQTTTVYRVLGEREQHDRTTISLKEERV